MVDREEADAQTPMEHTDTIEIRRLQLLTHIGVPDEERAALQTLLLTVRMTPSQGFHGLADDIAHTIDYHAVALALQQLAAAKPRKLIETLALEIADWLLTHHPLRRAEITLEKHILPDTECVAVHLVRE
jgi:7,8-dihydroneopterin aldolase/epimerase/oxygenase